MKTKRMLIFALLIIFFTWHSAMAEERNFSAGSLIIPMDSFYQSDEDGGILEAYGLAYYLLNHKNDDGEHDITVYWVINQEKVTIDAADFVIEDLTLAEDEVAAKLYDHAGGTSELTFKAGDSNQRVTYSGAPWVVDGANAELAKTIINQSGWSAVEVHEAQVPFAAPVHRELKGIPPTIALMDSSENGGNAKILESYLRLAGICNDNYEVVTPNQIRDGILLTESYDFLWAPHWHGSDSDDNGNGLPDVADIINQLKLFVEGGNGMLAECASIKEFEEYGRFLTSEDIDHNGGTNQAEDIIYNDIAYANSQIGDYAYEPEGGSLHNWRPGAALSEYNDTVTRFAIDNTGWDYYVGGYAFGDSNNGYVVYLGGHKYATCGATATEENPEPNVARLTFEFDKNMFESSVNPSVHPLEFEFRKDFSDENFTLLVKYDSGAETTVTFTKDDLTAQAGDPLEIDLTTVVIDRNKIKTLTFSNIGSATVTVDSITVSWSGGLSDQKLKKITDTNTGVRLHDSEVVSGVELAVPGFTIEAATGGDTYTLVFDYGSGSTSVTFSQADLNVKAGHPLEVDLTEAVVSGNKLESVILKNIGTQMITLDAVTVSWNGGPADQKLKKIKDVKEGETIFDGGIYSGEAVPLEIVLDIPVLLSGLPAGCTVNDDCSWKNIAGVRYVLNTLFNIKYQLTSHEYVRAAPIINHPYLYQGSFEYPSFSGHFRRYDVTDSAGAEDPKWDTADGGIKDAKNNNSDAGAREVFTAKNTDGTWSIINFDAAAIAELRSPLDLTPVNGDDSDEIAVINRVRGKYWNSIQSQWVEKNNKLGGIMHSAPVIVGSSGRVGGSRTEVAYVGDLYGMLHAIETASGNEKWAFIPQNLLGKLKNDRTDPNAVQDFAAVDASPTARDVYYDHDDDGDNEWRTILTGAEGLGGTSIYALDVTDPDVWSVLWEATDTEAPGGGMGHAYSVAISKVKWPVPDVDDLDGDGDTDEIIGYEIKWVVFLSAGFADIAVDHGGINVFAFDLKTGTKLWHFSSEYADAVNDIPGAVTVFDLDGDSFIDRLYVGDMNGRLWEIDAIDGTNPNGTEGTGDDTKEIPLYNAGIGNPISVSPAIVQSGGHTILIFGTGGANWAADDQAYAVYAVDATAKQSVPIYADGAGTLAWKVDTEVGEKIWSTPTVANGYIFLTTAFGSMEGSDPRMDISAEGQDSGNFYKLQLGDGSLAWKLTAIGKVRGSIFVNRQHAYMTTIDGQIIQIGGDDFAAGTGSRVVLRSWKQM